ncbi:MAG: FAD-dependent oxidoreductase [Solirubrobacteraceae bacterium]|nr:FAD-dependent oxidoreductase [Solirubrobacteraceae bacterium]
MTSSRTEASDPESRRRVAVFGGGVGGLTAAHELAERGFEVDLYERNVLGGKARSYRLEGTGTDGREDLPAEIGPHAVMGFYGTLPDQLRRVAGADGGSVLDAFAPLPSSWLAWRGIAARFPTGPAESPSRRWPGPVAPRPAPGGGRQLLSVLTLRDKLILAPKILALLTSGDERHFQRFEHQAVSEFLCLDQLSPEAQQLLKLIDGAGLGVLNRMNTRTLARVLTGFLRTLIRDTDLSHWFLIATGPFSEVMFDPWAEHLRGLGASIHIGHELTALECADGHVTSALVRNGDGVERTVEADWYVLAVPPERAAPILNASPSAIDPALSRVASIEPTILCGMSLYLTKPVPELHDLYYSAGQPWGVAAINYERHWGDPVDARYGDGTVKAYISIDIPDWDAPGVLYGKPARELSPSQIRDEVLEQLRRDLPDGERLLPDSAIHSWYLSPTTRSNGSGAVTHVEHLFVNTPSSLRNQPEATTGVRNLFLSAAYVRTDAGMGIDSMDSAAEAGRRAANGVLAASGSLATRADVPTWTGVRFLEPLRSLDDALFRRRRRNVFDRLAALPMRAAR